MHETTITLPGAQVVIRVYGTHESQPPPHRDTPGEEVPEGTNETMADVCGELARDPHLDELRGQPGDTLEGQRIVADPEVEVRWLRATHRLGAVLAQAADARATFLVAGRHKPREKQVPLARKLFTAAPCHTLLARLGEGGDDRISPKVGASAIQVNAVKGE